MRIWGENNNGKIYAAKTYDDLFWVAGTIWKSDDKKYTFIDINNEMTLKANEIKSIGASTYQIKEKTVREISGIQDLINLIWSEKLDKER